MDFNIYSKVWGKIIISVADGALSLCKWSWENIIKKQQQQPDAAHPVMLLYYSASIALETWLKTSSTGSSESTWTRRDGTMYENISFTCLLHFLQDTHLSDDATALIKGNDWLSCFVIQVQALLNCLLVVIRTAAGLPALQKPLDHRLGFCINVQQQAGFADLESMTFLSF